MPAGQLHLLPVPVRVHQRAAEARARPRQQQALRLRHLPQEVHDQAGADAAQEEARLRGEQRGRELGGGSAPLPPPGRRRAPPRPRAGPRGLHPGPRLQLRDQRHGRPRQATRRHQARQPHGHHQQAERGRGLRRQEVHPGSAVRVASLRHLCSNLRGNNIVNIRDFFSQYH